MKTREFFCTIVISDNSYNVRIQVKRIRHTILKISKNQITISTFRRLSEKEIYNIVLENKERIDNVFNKYKTSKLNSDEYLLFGTIYKKNGLTDKELAKIYDNAKEELKVIFENVRNKYNFIPCSLYIRKMISRWGVCYPLKGKIGLSTNLIFVRKELIEYVIIHEFCHFKYLNHSSDFYNELSKYYKNYKNLRKELKTYTVYF